MLEYLLDFSINMLVLLGHVTRQMLGLVRCYYLHRCCEALLDLH